MQRAAEAADAVDPSEGLFWVRTGHDDGEGDGAVDEVLVLEAEEAEEGGSMSTGDVGLIGRLSDAEVVSGDEKLACC
ncbi:hypothetical protein BGZ67_003950 [Mortierella alpina]|nr:hypothetical protein BGZ67_003950 [Mortierella alpina]